MKVIILGSGVVGVTTAYYLAKAGHEVVVVDRQPGAALETSFANAGQISPGYSAPWAEPGLPIKAVKWLLMQHYRPFVFRPSTDPALWHWLVAMLANCTKAAYKVNKGRMVRIAEYSRDKMIELRRDIGITYDERQQGTLQVFRTQKQLDHVGGDTAVLDQYGVPYNVLDAAGCAKAEPALARVTDKIVGGLRLPNDETGDVYLFTQALAKAAADLGVTFRYGETVARLETAGDKVRAVTTDRGTLTGDAYVVALASYSPRLLKPLGIKLPVYPVKGYSITVPITNPDGAPLSTVMDETYKVAITRLGDRIRVGGMAELAGYNLDLRASRRKTLEHSVGDLFPTGGDIAKARFWTGLRPMTPDGTPVIGPARFTNLHLNTGHGTLGWTMACGSGQLLADQLSGRTPDIETTDLSLARYR